MAIDRAKLCKLMLEELSYKESQVDGTIERLLGMDQSLVAALELWLDQRIMPEAPVFSGLCPQILAASYPLKPTAVFLLLDWIRRDPKEALMALQYEYGRLPDTRAGKPG